MRRTLRLKKVRILSNNKYSFLVFISESVCVLENTLSLVLGYYPAVHLLKLLAHVSFPVYNLGSFQLLLKIRP